MTSQVSSKCNLSNLQLLISNKLTSAQLFYYFLLFGISTLGHLEPILIKGLRGPIFHSHLSLSGFLWNCALFKQSVNVGFSPLSRCFCSVGLNDGLCPHKSLRAGLPLWHGCDGWGSPYLGNRDAPYHQSLPSREPPQVLAVPEPALGSLL